MEYREDFMFSQTDNAQWSGPYGSTSVKGYDVPFIPSFLPPFNTVSLPALHFHLVREQFLEFFSLQRCPLIL